MISVVIRTKNSENTLPHVIAGLGVTPKDEIIVVDSGSTDATLEIARERGAHVLSLEQAFHYSVALNAGFTVAKHDWVLSLSSHCIPAGRVLLDEYKRALVSETENLATIYGSIFLARRRIQYSAPQWITPERFAQTRSLPGGNGNALYRRSLWKDHPFTERLPTGEDVEWFCWAIKLGYSSLYWPTASVLYRNEGSLKRMFQKGVSEIRVSRGLLGARKLRWYQFVGALASLMKGVAFGDYPPTFAVRQSAHRLGVFIGSQLPPLTVDS